MMQLRKEVQEEIKKYFSDEEADKKLQNLMERLGTPPKFTTLRLNTMTDDLESVIMSVMDNIVKSYKERGRPAPVMYQHQVLKEVLVIENRGPALNIERMKNEIIVDIHCGMAVLRGADVFVQGILGAPAKMTAESKVSVYADLEGTFLKGRTKEHNDNKLFIGNGIVQYSRDQIFKSDLQLSGVGVLMTEPLYDAPSLHNTPSHLVFPQNLPSIVCTAVLDPQPGEVILDMCASPGGKTTHIATRMKNMGRLVALDKTDNKVEKIKHNADSWNLNLIEAYPYDAAKAVDDKADDSGGPPYPSKTFDRILLDGPCSALGQRPSLKNSMSLTALKSHPKGQRRIFEAAVELLKPGGTLVYSTCTITFEENEEQVAWALNKFPCLYLAEQVPHLGSKGRKCQGLSQGDLDMLQMFDLALLNSEEDGNVDTDTIGFFIAKFKKKSSENKS